MDTRAITKAEAVAAFGGNQAELGRALGLSRQRVGQFPDGPLPERYDLKLRFVVFPERGIEWPPSSDIDMAGRGCESEISEIAQAGAA